MASNTINVLVTSFFGLGCPPTLCVPVPSSTPASDLKTLLVSRLPNIQSRAILTTTSNKEITYFDHPIQALLPSENATILPLRLTAPLVGGKGGFGSQLRAAGGRMASKRKRHAGENNGSNRNLDGRRLRTVTEAKALAEYLALKPEMERKDKEARRRRWQEVVEAAERREEEVRNGSKGRVDGQWVEDKEEAGERTREAVRAAMSAGDYTDRRFGAMEVEREGGDGLEESSEEEEADEGSSDDPPEGKRESPISDDMTPPSTSRNAAKSRSYFGFDDDDEFMSDDSSEENEAAEKDVKD